MTTICTEPSPKSTQSAGPLPNKADTPQVKMPPIILAIMAGIYALCALQVIRAAWSTTGTFSFPLDDTYIGMALAKNLALHGVMGISPTRFASATSCPGFLLLLAGAYRLLGPSVWCPLALSLGFGLLALFMAQRLLAGTHWGIQLVALGAVIWFTPLHIIGLLGMEHTLHLSLVLAFLHLSTKALADRKSPSWGLMLLASAMVSVRYESLFVIAAACMLYLLQRQIKEAILLGAAGALPLAAYAIVSVAHHSNWLPQSVALKGLSGKAAIHSPLVLIPQFSYCLGHAPYLGVFLAIVIVLITLPSVRRDRRTFSMLAMVLGSIILHLAMADVGWVYRYEAYLVASAIVAIAFAASHVKVSRNEWGSTALLVGIGLTFLGLVLSIVNWASVHEIHKIYVPAVSALAVVWLALRVKVWRGKWAVALLLIFGSVGTYFLSSRALEANHTLPLRSMAIYYQQIQMARFLERFEDGATVAANDVGAINYYANIDCLDLAGLGDQDVFELKKRNAYSTAALAKLAADRKVKIALVYDTWFSTSPPSFGGPPLPASWIPVAYWRTPYAEFLGNSVVSFYATDARSAEQLHDSLARFAPALPPEVQMLWR